ncbi:hypothetical protein [Cetobacterium sp.]|uniref:hypothetical protein n=1 Tax=Cetobacterium sp. TaxID=2071632 RepID=UPI003F3D4B4B
MEKNDFTDIIEEVLEKNFPEKYQKIMEESLFIRYLKIETGSIGNSKTRSNLGNLYSIYSLINDYLANKEIYIGDYDGAKFTELLNFLRALPSGKKIQNHPLNNRINDKFFSISGLEREKNANLAPVIRSIISSRSSLYKINVELINFEGCDLAYSCKEIIEKFIEIKQGEHYRFISTCERLRENFDKEEFFNFISENIGLEADARKFEIISFSILKNNFSKYSIYIGNSKDNCNEVRLRLFKLGRTNANDGGIDFLLQPLGKVFQVTEDLNFKKYFLDIEKINHFKISFVVKTGKSAEEVIEILKDNASEQYSEEIVKKRYLSCIERIYTLVDLFKILDELSENLCIHVLDEIILQSKIEFNLE